MTTSNSFFSQSRQDHSSLLGVKSLFTFTPEQEPKAADSLKLLVDQLYQVWKDKQATDRKVLARSIQRDLLRPVTSFFRDKDLKREVTTHINSIISLLRLHYFAGGMSQMLRQKVNE